MIAAKRCPPAEGLIATGTYYLHQGQRKLGEESFQLFELPHRQGYQLHSALVLQWPLPHTQRVTLELEPTWRYQRLRIELEAEQHLTLARYHLEKNCVRARIEAAGRRPVEVSLAWEDALLDYPSALFVFALCKKLVLAPGESTEAQLVHISLPSLEPEQLRCRCARLFDHHETFEIGTFFVREFALRSPTQDELVHTWIDDAGVPIRIDRREQREDMRFSLVRYRLFRA
ncbi:MAG: hypothetical protein N3E42_06875 [Candidatus Bipolaricaulota bacterium]|nr:hypothetical protein [Candidatus Bipolaricaulota bacterium]